MSIKPEAPEYREEQGPPLVLGKRLEMAFEKQTRISPDDLKGRRLEFYDKKGYFIGSLQPNGKGNRDQWSFTFRYHNGGEVLLPSGYIDNVQQPAISNTMRFMIAPSGKVIFRNLREDSGNTYEMWDNLEQEDMKDVEAPFTSSRGLQELPVGGDGVLKGTIDDGKEFVLSTNREAGVVKDAYGSVNEDTVRAHKKNKRLVVVDGVGGYRDGHCVSHFGARCLGFYTGSLKEACINAASRVGDYVHFYSEAERGDAVYAVAEFHGDRVDLASTGDCRWLIIRNGKVFAKSPVRNLANELLREGAITEEQLYGDPTIARTAASYVTSFCTGTPDFDSRTLKQGDVVVLLSDGADALTDKEIAHLVSGCDAEEGHKRVLSLITERNKSFHYIRNLDDGVGCFATAPLDNVSVGVCVCGGL